MRYLRDPKCFALFLSLVLHAALLALVINYQFDFRPTPNTKPKDKIIFLEFPSAPVEIVEALPASAKASPARAEAIKSASARKVFSEKRPVSMAAPPSPTAEEWVFAAKYTNKNSKGYRYSWGQQVRSMMGTVEEGPDQGAVRFRVEIAPDGTLAKLETLWATSTVAERLARKAIETMPPLPPTPTGKLLIFERTISFTPYASEGPPSYKDDCLPDPPAFKNPFVWDGKSLPLQVDPPKPDKRDPKAMEECLRSLPQDSMDAEMASDKRIMDQWGSFKLGN